MPFLFYDPLFILMNLSSSAAVPTAAPSVTTAVRSPRKPAARARASSCRPSRRAANKSFHLAQSGTSAISLVDCGTFLRGCCARGRCQGIWQWQRQDLHLEDCLATVRALGRIDYPRDDLQWNDGIYLLSHQFGWRRSLSKAGISSTPNSQTIGSKCRIIVTGSGSISIRTPV